VFFFPSSPVLLGLQLAVAGSRVCFGFGVFFNYVWSAAFDEEASGMHGIGWDAHGNATALGRGIEAKR
jgi:hypothetical protein